LVRVRVRVRVRPGLGLGLGVRLVHPRLERDPRARRQRVVQREGHLVRVRARVRARARARVSG